MGESQHMLLNSTQLHLEEGEFLHQKAPGKNRTHDQDPPSSSLDWYFFDVKLQYKQQYLYIIPLAAFKKIEMNQQLDSKEFHFCFKILEKKNMKNSELKSIWGWPLRPLVVWAPIRTKRQQKESRNFTENKNTVLSLLDNELILWSLSLFFQIPKRMLEWIAAKTMTPLV